MEETTEVFVFLFTLLGVFLTLWFLGFWGALNIFHTNPLFNQNYTRCVTNLQQNADGRQITEQAYFDCSQQAFNYCVNQTMRAPVTLMNNPQENCAYSQYGTYVPTYCSQTFWVYSWCSR